MRGAARYSNDAAGPSDPTICQTPVSLEMSARFTTRTRGARVAARGRGEALMMLSRRNPRYYAENQQKLTYGEVNHRGTPFALLVG
jgi:hypothetical protein